MECVNEYSLSIISFFDILGFKDIVEKAQNPDEVLRILGIFERCSKQDEEIASMYEQKFSYFSDMVIRTTNILSKANLECQVGILFHELLDLIYVQCDLIHKGGILVRGSITIDEIYQDETYVFGPGFNKAYNLENNIAIYPRIIVDPRVFDWLRAFDQLEDMPSVLKANHHDLSTEEQYIESLVRESGDGIWFLDYAKVISQEVGFPNEYVEFLEHHKRLIVERSKGFENLDRVAVKYNWLARYHNAVVKSLSDEEMAKLTGARRQDLFITKDEVKTIWHF